MLRLQCGPWWGGPQGGPLFLFRTPLKALSVRPSRLPQVSGDSRKQEGGGCKETPKTKAETELGGAWGADPGDDSTKERDSHTATRYIY